MDNRIIRKRLLGRLGEEEYRPEQPEALAAEFRLRPDELPKFRELLKTLDETGLLKLGPNGEVLSARQAGLHTGTMRNLTKTGGFATLADGTGDTFIARENLQGAMPSDIVELTPVKKEGGLPEARVTSILQHNFSEFTGTFSMLDGVPVVTADSQVRSAIPVAGSVNGAHDGDKVLARFSDGKAEVLSAFGPATAAAACCRAVLGRLHVRQEFPPEVLAEARKVAALPESFEGRLDLRDVPILTIDSASSKDLDDAVSLEKTADGWKLGVHIADVSHFVTPGSLLNEEAYKRGTSIYYADSVIPMLPKELSNGICSLNPGEDRLAFSALMTLSEDGQLTGYRFHKSVIRSRVKGVYDEVNALFDGTADDALKQKYAEVLPSLMQMQELARRLTKRRFERGALDIDSADCKITVGPDGVVQNIERRVQGESERMIEEFMLCANESVAAFAVSKKMPLVFRVHDKPELKRLDDLKRVLDLAGIPTKGLDSNVTPLDFSRLMQRLRDAGKVEVFEALVLRAMAKAAYSPNCTGHFGLALKHYCHFTSPIRRYPDLVTHRILGEILTGATSEQLSKKYRTFTEEASEQSSACEVVAMQVERTCESIYMAEYMRARVGQVYPAFISSVLGFGIYVQLDNMIEGLIRVDDLPGGPYDFDENRLCLTDVNTHKRFGLGDKIRVLATRADTATGQIDFVLEGTPLRNGQPIRNRFGGRGGRGGHNGPGGHGGFGGHNGPVGHGGPGGSVGTGNDHGGYSHGGYSHSGFGRGGSGGHGGYSGGSGAHGADNRGPGSGAHGSGSHGSGNRSFGNSFGGRQNGGSFGIHGGPNHVGKPGAQSFSGGRRPGRNDRPPRGSHS